MSTSSHKCILCADESLEQLHQVTARGLETVLKTCELRKRQDIFNQITEKQTNKVVGRPSGVLAEGKSKAFVALCEWIESESGG